MRPSTRRSSPSTPTTEPSVSATRYLATRCWPSCYPPNALNALQAAHPGLPGDTCELAAELAQHAGDRGQAAAFLLEVGRRALGGGALTTAEATLDRARMLAPDADPVLVAVEAGLAEVLSVAGKRDRAVEVCESLLA